MLFISDTALELSEIIYDYQTSPFFIENWKKENHNELSSNWFLNFPIETGSCENFIVKKWTNQVLLWLAYSAQIK